MKLFVGVLSAWLGILLALWLLPQTAWVLPEQESLRKWVPKFSEPKELLQTLVDSLPVPVGDSLDTRAARLYFNRVMLNDPNTLEFRKKLAAECANDPVLLSSIMRFGGIGLGLDPDPVKPLRPEAELVIRQNADFLEAVSTYGVKAEPDNMLWVFVKSTVAKARHDDTEAERLLLKASQMSQYSDHAIDHIRMMFRVFGSGRPLSGREKATIWANEMFPHYSWFSPMAVWATKRSPTTRLAAARIGMTLMAKADSTIGRLVGVRIVKETIIPGHVVGGHVDLVRAAALDQDTLKLHPMAPHVFLDAGMFANRTLDTRMPLDQDDDVDDALSPWNPIIGWATLVAALSSLVVSGLTLLAGKWSQKPAFEAGLRNLVWFTVPLAAMFTPQPHYDTALAAILFALLTLIVMPFSYFEKTRSGATLFGWFACACVLVVSIQAPGCLVPCVLWAFAPRVRQNWNVARWIWPVVWPMLITASTVILSADLHDAAWFLAAFALVGVSAIAAETPPKSRFQPAALALALFLLPFMGTVYVEIEQDKRIGAMVEKDLTLNSGQQVPADRAE